jgi:hypothetical protein
MVAADTVAYPWRRVRNARSARMTTGTSWIRFRTGDILTTVGAALGVLGGIALGIEARVTMTPSMREVLFYKELFVASAVLLVLGAIIGRRQRAEKKELEARVESQLSRGSSPLGDERSAYREGREETREER